MCGGIKLHQQFAVFRPRKLHGVLKGYVFTYAHREAIRIQRKNISVQRAHSPVQRALVAGCGERIGIYGNAHCAPVQPIAHGGGGAVYIRSIVKGHIGSHLKHGAYHAGRGLFYKRVKVICRAYFRVYHKAFARKHG